MAAAYQRPRTEIFDAEEALRRFFGKKKFHRKESQVLRKAI